MWRFPDDPQQLKAEYILRCTAVRLVLLWFCFTGVDDALTSRISCHALVQSGPQSCAGWSWLQRSGLLGLQLQLALALAGVVWPFVHMPTYERKHTAYQQVLAWGSMAGKVLELVSGVTGAPLGRASEAAMMLHTILFAAQQHSTYPLHLAAMLVVYSCCHALGGSQSLLAAALSGGRHPQPSSSSSSSVAGSIINASASYLTMYMTGLVLHSLITWYAPSTEQPHRVTRGLHAWSRASHTSLAAPDSPSGMSGMRRSMSGLSVSSAAALEQRAAAIEQRSNSWSSTKQASSHADGKDCSGRAWCIDQNVKFMAVRSVDGLFLVLLSVHLVCQPPHASAQPGMVFPGIHSQQTQLQVPTAGLVAAALAVWQLVHAIIYWLGPPLWFTQHSLLGCGALFYPAVAARTWLVLSGGPAIGPGQVFPMLLVVAAQLAVHEERRSLFGLQLAALAAGARYMHQQLLSGQPLPSGSPGVDALLPEYAAITVMLTVGYGCVCLGKQQGSGMADRQQSLDSGQVLSKACDNEGADEGWVASARGIHTSSRPGSPRQSASAAQSRRPTGSARSSFNLPPTAYAKLQVDVGLGSVDEETPPPAPLLAAPLRRPPSGGASFVGPMDAYSNALLVPAPPAGVTNESAPGSSTNAVPESVAAAANQEAAQAAGHTVGVADSTPPSSPRKGRRKSILWAEAAVLALEEVQSSPDVGANSSSRQSSGGSLKPAAEVSREGVGSNRPWDAAAEQPPGTTPFALAATAQLPAPRPAGASRLRLGNVAPPRAACEGAPEATTCTTPRGSATAPSRSLSRARSLQRGLSMQSRISCAGAASAEENSSSQSHQQQVAYDALLLLVALLRSSAMGGMLLPIAWQMAVSGSVLPATLAMACALLHMGSSLPCLVYLRRDSAAALERRELIWSCRVALGPLTYKCACALLGLPAFTSPRAGLVFIAAFLGLTHVSVPTFARWLPPMVAIHFWGYVRLRWSAMSWVRLAVEGIEFNLCPVLAYTLTHAAGGWLQGQALRLLPLLLNLRSVRKRGQQHTRLVAVWAGACAQVAVGMSLMALLAEWQPALVGSMRDAPLTPHPLRESLLQALEALFHADNLDSTMARLGVLACLWVLPVLHLLAAITIRRHRRSRSQPNKPQPSAAEADSRLWGKEDLQQQQQMGMDTISYIAAWPVFPLVSVPAIIRCIWPAAAVLWWRRGFALTVAAAAAALYTGRAVHAVQQPQAAARWRDWYWCACHGGVTSVMQLAGALLGVAGFWPPLLEHCLTGAVIGLMQVTHLSFAVWLSVVSTFYFSAHLVYHGSNLSWTVMAAEALEYSLYPSISYGITRMVLPIINPTMVAYIMNTALQRGYIRTPAQHKQWAVWSAMGSVMSVGVGPLWCIALGVRLPAFMDPAALAIKLKAELVSMFYRMGLSMGSQADTLRTLLAMPGVGVCFLAVSGLQALLLNNPAFRNPRQSWYEACKARVMLLGETTLRCLSQQTDATGPQQLRDTLLVSLQEVLQGCFPGCTVMVVLMEDKGSLYRGMARRYLLQAAPEAADMPASDLLALGELPSVEQACQHGQIVYDSSVRPGTTGYGDWEAMTVDYGMDGFLTAPLSSAGAAMGALVLAASVPVSIDRYLRRLAGDVAQSLSQTLYTLSCIEQMRAAEQIIHDIMPEKVADELKRRVADPSRSSPHTPSSPATPRGGPGTPRGSPSAPFHASSLYKSEVNTSHGLPPSARRSMDFAGARRARLSTAGSASAVDASFGEVPVVYKQWHSSVSVLFADISSYTAMSTQVEPEQVMMLLHELFSKYDNLCTHYNVYKVETIGDCYMACCGLLTEDPDHAANMVQYGQAMLQAASTVRSPLGGSVHIRVGVHSGRVMSGIVGSIRARYCLFGDTVNTASRMESTGVVDHIQVSQDTYQLLGALQDDFELRTDVCVKGKGVMQTYVLREDVAQQLTDAYL